MKDPGQASIREVIVVEGKNDTAAVRRALGADTIETGGSAIDDRVLREIRRAHEARGVIVFTDPDHEGERIRRVISREIPGVKHAFLPRDKALGKGKVGVEHASPEAIREAVERVRSTWSGAEEPPLTWEEYVDTGFSGMPDSREFRRRVAELLGIGYANARQFYRRLHLLGVGREELREAIREARKEIDG
ncbi:ribonuclease M5 [Staphylospora marina]|uniref:ribonuclease M5 n=1 Tax=Staphylospora marina TaxID=2490858 RepID=UPI000F5BA231|nr:ribonuclease M5 [Staphylospora marina]